MSDNTTLNAGTGGDSIRTVDRTYTNTVTSTSTSVKTQVMQLDIGGDTSDPSTESIVTAANPLPVDTPDHAVTNALLLLSLRMQAAQMSANGSGFVPMETPDFLTGV